MEAIMVCLFPQTVSQLKEVNRRAEIDAIRHYVHRRYHKRK